MILNTTAVNLSLGTGGYHFVIFNYSNPSKELEGKGHIMKMRYTPFQIKCLSAEEEDSPYHEKFNSFKSLEKKIFILAEIHSMLAPIAAMIKWLDPTVKVNYIMTDGGALPIGFSNTVKLLKEKKIIDKTVTIGHSFGGDLECVNIYTGLIAAKEILESDITVISMGPGIVGTGSKYGFSGIEQGYISDAVNNLGGTSLIVPRISFKDKRTRHQGVSHHTLTVLGEVSNTKSTVIIPLLGEKKNSVINEQFKEHNIFKRHNVVYEDGKDIEDAMKYFDLNITTMNRGYKDDEEYFITLGAVGKWALSYLKKGR